MYLDQTTYIAGILEEAGIGPHDLRQNLAPLDAEWEDKDGLKAGDAERYSTRVLSANSCTWQRAPDRISRWQRRDWCG